MDRLFPELYYFTTKHWLDFARTSRDPIMIHLLIVHFFDLYRKYAVHEQGQPIRIVPHWKRHAQLLAKGNGAVPFRSQAALLLGIHAHVRFDLAEAIILVWRSYRERYDRNPDLGLLRSMIYGEQSDLVFRKALQGFLQGREVRTQVSARVLAVLASRLEHLWLPVLKRLREEAWREAMTSIRTGAPIRRMEPVQGA
ncbi:hypothetical protein [Roseibium sediminicola]|uniref:Uncharacterized protein n=1 Tax=Roseibium sediminicola TaxID=2933272 RepID=A0ABT0H132_9HYPH|nr:hypothetical protein [Roseibium sp. CAU 1639]